MNLVEHYIRRINGHIGECTEWWKKSYYIEVLEKGYFLA